jgi:hypothetical protein
MSKPEDSFSQIHDLYQGYEEAKKFKKGVVKDDELLLAKWSESKKPTFIYRDSWKGRVIRLLRFLGIRNHEKELKEITEMAREIFERVDPVEMTDVYIEKTIFQRAKAQEMTTKVQTALQVIMPTLGLETRSGLKALSIQAEEQLRAKVQTKEKDDIEKISGLLRGLSQNEKSAITQCLSSSTSESERDDILKALTKEHPDTAPLRRALMQRLTTLKPGQMNDEAIENLLKAIRSLSQQTSEGELDDEEIDDEKMVEMVDCFFLGGAGLKKATSWDAFVGRITDFYEAKKTDEEKVKNAARRAPPQTPAAQIVQRLRSAITIQDTTDPTELMEAVNKKLRESGKCLVLDQFDDQGIVYEFERQKAEKRSSQKYTLRVYNKSKGEEFESHHKVPSKGYKQRREGCRVFRDIDTTADSYTEFFQTLANTPKDAATLTEAIGKLNGKEGEARDGRMHRGLSAKNPEVSYLSSLLAWVSEQEKDYPSYRLDKYEMRKNLLEEYLPHVQKMAQQSVDDSKDYDAKVETRARMKRVLEKFASGLTKTSAEIPVEKQEEARMLILTYETALFELDRKILAFEKSKELPAKLSEIKADNIAPPTINLPHIAAVADLAEAQAAAAAVIILRKPLSEASATILAQIKLAQIHEAIKGLAEMGGGIPSEEYLYVFQEICRAVWGTVQNWDNIQFTNPKEAFTCLRTIQGRIIGDFRFNGVPHNPSPEQYFMFLSAQYGMEQAFKKIPENHGAFDDLQSSLGSDKVRDMVGHLPSSDPLWVAFKESLARLPRAQGLFSPFSMRSESPGSLTVLGNHLKKWYVSSAVSEDHRKAYTPHSADLLKKFHI